MIFSLLKWVAELEACLANMHEPTGKSSILIRAGQYLRKMKMTLLGARRTFERFHDKTSYKVALADFIKLTVMKSASIQR